MARSDIIPQTGDVVGDAREGIIGDSDLMNGPVTDPADGLRLAASAPPLSHSQEAMTRLLRPSNMIGGQALYIAANAGLWFLLRGRVPAPQLLMWECIALVSLASMAILHIGYYRADRSGPDAIRRWLAFERMAIGDEVLAVASIFILLPYADPSALLFATAFYIGYVPSGILSEPGNVMRLRRSTIVVLGSFAIFLAIYAGPVGKMLSVVVLGYAAFLFKGIVSIHRIVLAAVTAREDARNAAEETQAALADVTAARDAATNFIAAASHDLGQPLQAANLYFGQVMDAPEPAQRQAAASGVRRAIDSMQQLLSHMMNHLRLQADAVSPHLSRIAIGQSMANVAARFEGEARTADVTIVVVPTRKVILADPALLDRLIGNLLSNAIVHAEARRVLIGIKSSSTAGGGVRLWVVDDGVGIGNVDAAHIFDDYYRGTASSRAPKGGFGLGLASVRRIAALLGGTAGIDRRWVRGAAFYLDLPASVMVTA